MAHIVCNNCGDFIRITDAHEFIQVIMRYEEVCKECKKKGKEVVHED